MLKIKQDDPKPSFSYEGKKISYALGIKTLRKKLGLNTKNFGAKVGVSGRTVEGWEQGRREPSRANLMLMRLLLRNDKYLGQE